MSGVPHLQELHDKFSEKGFKICAVSSEKADLIQKKFIDGKKVTYGVVKADIGADYASRGITACWVLDAEGKCLFKGHPSGVTSEKVKKWIENIVPLKITEDLGKSLKNAVKSYNSGEYGKAQKQATDVKASGDETTKNADVILDLITRRIELGEKKVETLKAAGDLVKAGTLLEELADSFKGSEKGEEFEKSAKELIKSKEYKDAVKASGMLEKLRTKLPYMTEKKAQKDLEKIIKKYPETKAGKEAAEMIKDYE